ncbi:hypothetical protein ACNHKD_14100 [Methylocystis sp. JAN1]|uniref:hypothetical protein n=1 Tax=Methylocystis sp. JAN1 TaxID=3397211 RepID=UPI003FA2771E
MDGGGKEEKNKLDVTPIGMMFDPMEQMRELLFGATKRETEKELAKLEQKLETLRQEVAARFDAFDARLAEVARDAEKSQAESLMAIGGALAELGERIKAMSEKRNV